MSAFHDIVIAGASGSQGYQIQRSVRLRSSASAYFNRTPASAGNQQKWTWSGWLKRGQLGAGPFALFNARDAGAGAVYTIFDLNSDSLRFLDSQGASLSTAAVYRDPSAYYHIVLAVDTTQATAANRVVVYVNSASQTLSGTSPSQNISTYVNAAKLHRIGANDSGVVSQFFDGYLTEVNFIDGQALTPSSFGETDTITGVWKPKKYTGTYGTNGFFLNFSDNSAATAAAIGKDYSGNGNNWTPNNISVTAGATYDSMLDVPTAWADGGNGRGNYAVLNPLAVTASTASLSNGNLSATGLVVGGGNAFATIALPSSGKFYWEITPTNLSGDGMIGVGTLSAASSYFWQNTDGSLAYYSANGNRYLNNSASAYGATYAANDVIGVAADIDAGTVTFYKNNASQGAIAFNAAGLLPAVADGSGSFASNFTANFGQRPFAYTPPTGFKALHTGNLPEPTIKKGNQYFDALTYTSGVSAAQNITGAQFQPDLAWFKSRGSARHHALFDSVRGANAGLYSSLTNAENTWSGQAFLSNGFTVDRTFSGETNGTGAGEAFVTWMWKEGATPGFDIVTYTGDGAASKNISHALGVAPSMMIVKSRSAVNNWRIYHAARGATKFLEFTTGAEITQANIWNNTAPTSSVFTVGADSGVNGSGASLVAYLFSEVAGFSKFGSYTGNGSTDGPFVFCGFRPRFVMVKRTDSAVRWIMYDTSRDTYNASGLSVYPNFSTAEEDGRPSLDLLSNGFKLRNIYSEFNASGGTYIFAAFAENPFKYSLAR